MRAASSRWDGGLYVGIYGLGIVAYDTHRSLSFSDI